MEWSGICWELSTFAFICKRQPVNVYSEVKEWQRIAHHLPNSKTDTYASRNKNFEVAGRLDRSALERAQFSYCVKFYKDSFFLPAMATDANGMRGYRSRNQNGMLRDKRDDTHIGTVEKKYDLDLGVRSDMHLGTYLELHGIESLNDLVNGQ